MPAKDFEVAHTLLIEERPGHATVKSKYEDIINSIEREVSSAWHTSTSRLIYGMNNDDQKKKGGNSPSVAKTPVPKRLRSWLKVSGPGRVMNRYIWIYIVTLAFLEYIELGSQHRLEEK